MLEFSFYLLIFFLKKKLDSNIGFVTVSRRKRVTANNKPESKRDDANVSSGGTWPRCRAGSPFTSGEYLEGTNTLFHSYKYPRARLPLSVFIDASKCSKDEVIVDDTTDDDKDSRLEPIFLIVFIIAIVM